MPDPTEMDEYSKFYRDNVERLITFLILQGWSKLDAADCVQETLIMALPPKWAAIENPAAWCRTVAYRKACNLHKRRREQLVNDLERIGAPLIASDTKLEEFEQVDQLLYWLKQLHGPRQREVLVWTYDGAKPAEIAAELGMTPAAVRSTLRDARANLRRCREDGGSSDV